jgi:hypothetical protein
MTRTIEVVEIPMSEDTNEFLKMFYASMDAVDSRECSREIVA